MKKCILVLGLGLVLGNLFAQDPIQITVTEGSEVVNETTQNALKVVIYEATKKDVDKAFKSELKSNKAKVTAKKEIFGDDASFKFLGENTVDVYAKTVETKDNSTELIVSVDLGGAYLSSADHKEKFDAFKGFLYGFAVTTTKEALAGQVKDAEKVLKGKEKEKEDLIKTNEDLHKSIEDYKAKIEQAEKDIEKNIEDQANKDKEIEDQTGVITILVEREKAVK